MNSKKIGLYLGPILFLLTLMFFRSEGLSKEGVAILASTLWIAVWWITEAIPIAVTSLLPIVLFPLTGGLTISATTGSYGHRFVFLYIGGFILAIAIERWQLHKRIALNIINIIGTNVKSIILGFMVATAFLSMWISNTATSIMMLPIGMAIILQLRDNPDTIEDENRIFGKALMLAIAYSASIGGVATLIGTPPNLVLAGVVSEIYNVEISFSQWMMFGLPISITLLIICWKYLTSFAFKFKQKSFPGGRDEIKKQLASLGALSIQERRIMYVFAGTALAWISRSFLPKIFGWLLLTSSWGGSFNGWIEKNININIGETVVQVLSRIDDTVVAIISGIILFIIPAGGEDRRKLINWDEAVKLPWGILLLFGGGLALAEGFKTTGLAEWIGSQMTLLDGVMLSVVLLVIIAAVNFLTEITSNLATTAMILPILAPLALTIDVHPYILMFGATVAASCAFMLPVATPPNAVVFGSGYLRIPDMVKAGIWMNLISIILLTIITYFLLPYVWDFDPNVFPEGLKNK